ncbi:MAG: alpha-amylase family glycosyl hydrolase [Chitinophagales bacterium]|mgnify:CR=1 FL=1|nr:alpha-amylase family glycosyl hydrolase [Chitinophagales bacterium]
MKKLHFIVLFSAVSFTLFAQHQSSDWWRTTTIYQIYPRSFYDTNGDGIGDLQGIIEKLDYIKQLGFETIWISPFFQSPQQDFGYDISDYNSIAPEYGDMQLCEKLIEEVHRRNMKIVFDLVMNHTSAQHNWFLESRSSRDNPKADWYVWRDGKGRGDKNPPNNWKAMIGGNGWDYDSLRQQYYWASFLPFQPDLNYRNPEVKQAMLDVARYWLAKGVDGFRLDIFNALYEDASLRDNPFSFRMLPSEENPDVFFQKTKYTLNQEESFQFATELRSVVDEFDNPKRFLVGEVFGDSATLKSYCKHNGKEGLHTVFLFETLGTSFNATLFRHLVEKFEAAFHEPFQPTYVFSNHDRIRSIARLGGSVEKAKLLALLQYTVRGIPFTYYGEELGIPRTEIPMKEGKDPLAERYSWMPQFLVNLSGESLNRDECRTPMLWNEAANAGFCDSTAQPWLPVSENYNEIHVARQQLDSASLLNFYKQVIALRNATPALQNGKLSVATAYCTKHVFAFYRREGEEKYLVALNFSKKKRAVAAAGEQILSTHARHRQAELLPFEGRVFKIE